ncbi:GTP-binding protein 1 [Quaeritorhiza haematococci]|nr:GTP-binding protein 1 [Quaeritorhiza haematococci]
MVNFDSISKSTKSSALAGLAGAGAGGGGGRISASAAVALAQKLAATSLNDHNDANENDSNAPAALFHQIHEDDQVDLEDGSPKRPAKEMYVSPTDEDLATIVHQLDERIRDGQGETVFDVGVQQDGTSMDLTEGEFTAFVETLKSAANKLDSDVTIIHRRNVPILASSSSSSGATSSSTNGSSTSISSTLSTSTTSLTSTGFSYGHVLIRQRPGDVEKILEIRIAVVGNVDAGKSTLLGVLTKNVLDDGRGKARVNLFRHKHEIESGRTSSVGMEITGFDSIGNIITPTLLGKPRLNWEDIVGRASKVLSFIDLAGHEKYLKTTVFGMTGCAPDFVMLMIGSNAGIIGMTKEHLGLALALQVPVFIVVTKIDMCPANVLEATLKQLTKILKSSGCRKIPMFINTMEDVIVTAGNFVSERICPIFQVSNVTGHNLDLLRTFLNVIHANGKLKYDINQPVEYAITDTFSVPGVGTVVSGTVMSGVVHVGDTLLLGPDSTGNFTPTVIKSMQRKRVNVVTASAGQSASFALKKMKRSAIRKGMYMLSKSASPRATLEFEAEILVLYHSTTINTKYQAMLHCGCVRQTAKIVSMDKSVLRTGDRAIVRFRFLQHPEYLKVGTRLLFREGRTKGVGKVVRTLTDAEIEEHYQQQAAAAAAGPNGASASTTGAAGGSGGVGSGVGVEKKKPPNNPPGSAKAKKSLG